MATRAKTIAGITIEIGADTTKLGDALKGVDSQLRSTQSKLTDVNKLLKMDPSNVTLLTQKQKDLKEAINETSERLKTLKSVKKDSLSAEEYDTLQREIVETEQKLDSLKKEYKDFGSVSGQALKAVGENIKDTGKKITEVGQNISTKVTLPLVAVGTAGVTAFAEVDKTMQLTNKTMSNTEEEAQLLNQAMKDAAANSTFGMKDAAEATLNFARAGLDAEQAANALAPAMNLAAGEGGNLDTVSGGLVATINGFHGSFEDAGKYADVFAAACNSSALDVDSLSSAMSVAAPIFASAGYTVNDAALYMGVMANNGIDANKAANSLKTGLARLVSPAKEGAAKMAELGISVTNADGSMKDSVTIQNELHDAFANLSEAEQIAAASAIFGKNQMAPWLALINTAPSDVDKLDVELKGASKSVDSFSKQLKKSGASYDTIKSRMEKLGISGDTVDYMFKTCNGDAELFKEGLLEAANAGVTMDDVAAALGISMEDLQTAIDNTAGTTEEMAEAMMSGFGGSIEKLKSSLDVLVTSIGEALAPTIQKVTEFIQNLVDKFNALTPAQQETIAKIGLVVAAIGPALVVIGKVVTGIGGIVTAIGGFLTAVGGLLPGGLIIVGLISAGTLITRHWDEIKAWATETLIPALLAAWERLKEGVGVVVENLKAFWTNTLEPAWNNMWTWVETTLIPALIKAWEGFKVTVGVVFEALKGFWHDTLQPALQNMWTWVQDTLIPALSRGWENFKETVSVVFDALKGFWTNTLYPALQDMWTWITTSLIPAIQSAWENLKPKVEAVFTAMKSFWTDTLNPALQSMWTWITESLIPAIQSAWEDLQPKIEAVFKAIKGFWEDTLKPALTELWRFVTETVIPDVQKAWEDLQPVVETVFNAIKGFWENTLKPAFEAIKEFLDKTLKPVFENTFDAISKTVDTSLKAIEDLWNKSVKPIYDGILKFFSGTFSGDWEKAWSGIQDIVSGVWEAIQTAAEKVWEDAKTWATTIINNFQIAFNNAWDGIKDKVTGVWNDITNKVTEIWEGALEWGKNIIDNFWTSLQNAWTDFIEKVRNKFAEIPKVIKEEVIDKALNWGRDLIDNFKKGIEEKWDGLKRKVSDVGQSIKDFLGFSKPKTGPLSDFDTYAPDMMDLFVKGINDNIHKITSMLGTMVSNIRSAFKLAGENAYNSFNEALNGTRGDQLQRAIKGPVEQAADAIKTIDWYGIGRRIYDGVTAYTDNITRAFRNTFDFSSMHVKTPHIYVAGWNTVSDTSYPYFGVSWYRKAYENPVMFNNPTVLGTSSGLKGFGDGPGGEIVLSADKLREIVGESGDININVYAQPGQDAQQIAQEVQRILVREQLQRSAAYA